MVLRLAANTWVLVADGGKARVFVNEADALSPRLREIRTLGHDNPAAHEQGDDKPGRYHDGRSPHRSAVEMSDPHDEAEKSFLADIAGGLDEDLAADRFTDLVVVAEPRALGRLRRVMGERLKDHVRAEIAKDYTKETPDALAKAVVKELEAS